MLSADNLDQLEEEKQAKWELFAQLMDLDPDFKFTAKELARELDYSKSELNKLLFRLYVEKALLMRGTARNGAKLYSLTPAFLNHKTNEN